MKNYFTSSDPHLEAQKQTENMRLFDSQGRHPREGPDIFQRPWQLDPAIGKAEREDS